MAEATSQSSDPTSARAPTAARGLRARWLDLRDRLLASQRFHRFAAAFPLTRPFARRRARALFDLCAGFVYSQTLLACVRLNLFEVLSEGPQPVDPLAARLGLDRDAALRLLNAAVSLELVARRGRSVEGGDLYGLGELGAALRGAAGVAEMVEHHALLYSDLSDPVALLRGERDTALRRFWAYVDRPAAIDAQTSDAYSRLMAASQPFVSEEVLDAYPLRRHRRLLDVGGGEGAFLSAVAARAPALQLMLFDLPEVARRAEKKFSDQGLSDRTTCHGGSFFDDPLPRGADAVSLVRVLYDHDDAAAAQILSAARAALEPGGTLIVAEPMAGTPGAEPIGAAYFGFYLLAMGGGRPRRPEELSAMITAAGFAKPRIPRTRRPLLSRVLVAKAI